MAKSDGSRITGREALSFLTQFTWAFDHTAEFSAALKAKGFTAFEPLLAWDEIYAQNEEELLLERLVRRERSKELFARAARRMLPDGTIGDNVGRSPFLDKLRGKRDLQNGCSENELEKRFALREASIRMAITDVERRRRLEPQEISEKMRFRALDQAFAMLQHEATVHATVLSNRTPPSIRGRCEIFRDVAGRVLGRYGFSAWVNRGARVHPIVRKKLNNDWELRWTLQKDLTFLAPPEGFEFLHNFASYSFFDELYVCASHASTNFQESATIGQYFTLQYHGLVPFIWQGYNKFATNSELETAILARASLIGLFLDQTMDIFTKSFK